jgi:hypothetical protein
MTGESDSALGRRPPTIELKATEVEQPKRDAHRPDGAAQSDSRSQGASSEQRAPHSAEQAAAQAQAATRSGGRWMRRSVGGAFGALAIAVVTVGLWYAGVLPRHETASPTGTATPQSAPVEKNAAGPAAVPNALSNEISARLDKIERAIEPQRQEQHQETISPVLANRMATQEAQTKALSDTLAALNRRLDDIAANAQTAQNQAAAATSAADATKSAGQSNAQRSDIDALVSRVAALESAVKALADAVARPTNSADSAARLTIAAEALRNAVERDAPYESELKAVQALAGDRDVATALAPFAITGVPRADALARELAGLVPALQRATQPASADNSFLGRLEANAQKLVRVTPVDAPPGNDPTSVVKRISIDAHREDIAAALRDVSALPDAAKPIVADWVKTAQAREAALAAGRKIAADALAALSKPAAQ